MWNPILRGELAALTFPPVMVIGTSCDSEVPWEWQTRGVGRQRWVTLRKRAEVAWGCRTQSFCPFVRRRLSSRAVALKGLSTR